MKTFIVVIKLQRNLKGGKGFKHSIYNFKNNWLKIYVLLSYNNWQLLA